MVQYHITYYDRVSLRFENICVLSWNTYCAGRESEVPLGDWRALDFAWPARCAKKQSLLDGLSLCGAVVVAKEERRERASFGLLLTSTGFSVCCHHFTISWSLDDLLSSSQQGICSSCVCRIDWCAFGNAYHIVSRVAGPTRLCEARLHSFQGTAPTRDALFPSSLRWLSYSASTDNR